MGIDMDAKFDMDSVEKERYENISTWTERPHFQTLHTTVRHLTMRLQNQGHRYDYLYHRFTNSAKQGILTSQATGNYSNRFLTQDKGLERSFKLNSNT
jgi:hypothetical protein